MKKYIKPNTEVQELELEQILAGSIAIENEEASTSGGYYDDSRMILLFDED